MTQPTYEELTAENAELKATLKMARITCTTALTSNARVVQLEDALKLALEYWGHRQQRYKNRHPVWVNDAQAALSTPTDAKTVLMGMLEEVGETTVYKEHGVSCVDISDDWTPKKFKLYRIKR